MSTNARIIRDSLISVLHTVEAETDSAERYRIARDLRAIADKHLRGVEDKAAYDGARLHGVLGFAAIIGVAHSVISLAASRHVRNTGAAEYRPSLRIKQASQFDVSNRRR